MKNRRHRRTRREMRTIRLWNYADAAKALPYLRSLTGSLRDHWLELQCKQLEARRMHALAKPSRTQRIAMDDTEAEARRAEAKFDDALEELMGLDIFLLDPVQGLALIPFQQKEELAWYVFDLFDPQGLTSWRYHKDPLETRRPVPAEPENERPLAVSGNAAV